MHRAMLLGVLGLASFLWAGVMQPTGTFSTVAGRAASSSVVLEFAAGQPAAGQASGAAYLAFGGLYHMAPVRFLRGDVNGDGLVDLRDLDFLARYLYLKGPPPSPLGRGDTNLDGAVNDLDLVNLSARLLHTRPPLRRAPAPRLFLQRIPSQQSDGSEP